VSRDGKRRARCLGPELSLCCVGADITSLGAEGGARNSLQAYWLPRRHSRHKAWRPLMSRRIRGHVKELSRIKAENVDVLVTAKVGSESEPLTIT